MWDNVEDMDGLMSAENVPATFPCFDLFHIWVIRSYPGNLQLALAVDNQGISETSGSREY